LGLQNSVIDTLVCHVDYHLVLLHIYLAGLNGRGLLCFQKKHRETALGIVGVASLHRGGYPRQCQREFLIDNNKPLPIGEPL